MYVYLVDVNTSKNIHTQHPIHNIKNIVLENNDIWQEFDGCENFRQRIILSTLSGKPTKISNIRVHNRDSPGLKKHEASFLRLIDKLSNGCGIKINNNGTVLWYRPGVLIGGDDHDVHVCPTNRGITYYLDALLYLAPFCKHDVAMTLQGVTNNNMDLCVDTIQSTTIPLLKHFGISNDISLKVNRRGAPPDGGGEIHFKCSIVKQLNPITILNCGKIKRVRGTAYCTKTTPQMANRMAQKARSILNNFIPDVFIATDTYKGATSGNSPGFGIALHTLSTSNMILSSDGTGDKDTLPEDVASIVTKALCEEIASFGCIDTHHQALMILFMALGPEDVSKIKIGKLSPQAISMLRLIKVYFGVTFKIRSTIEEAANLKRRRERNNDDNDDKALKKRRKNVDDDDDDDDGGSSSSSSSSEEEEAVDTLVEDNDDDNDNHMNEAPTLILSCIGVGFKNYARATI